MRQSRTAEVITWPPLKDYGCACVPREGIAEPVNVYLFVNLAGSRLRDIAHFREITRST